MLNNKQFLGGKNLKNRIIVLLVAAFFLSYRVRPDTWRFIDSYYIITEQEYDQKIC